MTTRSVKANALRERHAATLKKTIETVISLTGEACISTMSVYKCELEANWTHFNDAFNEHEDSIIGRDGQETLLTAIANEHRDIYTNYLKARIKLGKLASAANPATNSFNSTMFEQSLNSEQTKPFKLTPIRVPMFNGDLNIWAEFKATCRSVLTDKIHDVARLQLLKEALKGEPRELVQHVLPGDGCYERAMLLLKKRYENPRTLVNSQLRRLYTIPHNEPNRENIVTLRTIMNTINSLKAALDGCEIDTSTWDAILVFNTSQCLHAESLKAWEEKLEGTRVVPSLSQYLEFLETRIIILETTQTISSFANLPKARPPIKFNGPSHAPNKPKILFTLSSDYACAICSRNHLSSRCDELPRMTKTQDRIAAVKKSNACFNCLQPFHLVKQCPFDAACKKCKGNHHTLLHEDGQQVMLTQSDAIQNEETNGEENNDNLSNACSAFFYHVNDRNTTILATALVPVQYNGRSVVLKALVDQGSTASLITHKACQMLKLPYSHDNTAMTGVGNAPVGRVIGRAHFTIGSIQDRNYKFDTNALVVKHIADISPLNKTDLQNWDHLSNLSLADPSVFKANKIDILLGATVYAEIILGNVAKGKPDEPIAQSTKLGWIIFGQATVSNPLVELCNTMQDRKVETVEDDLSDAIRAFWEMEEVEMPSRLKAGEIAAEESFVKNLKRSPDGKFMVDLPFKVDPKANNCLGESKTQAEKRLRSSQRRFDKNQNVRVPYDQNLNEYLTLGHMREIENHEIARCFLPHHPVVKESSSTTKVRTVFDASAKTTNGRSLNDILYVGPTIQPDLFDLLIKWRRYRYAFSGDIEKMYRQVWVNPDHTLFQCILWQPPDSNEIKTYKLLTVTFGTASAPYQAIRAVDEIGKRIENEDPTLAEQIRKCFYVDDYLGTTDDVQSAIKIREQITTELAKYGFKLRKWKANDERILMDVECSEKEEVVDFDTTFKTLGIAWQPSTDTFQFKSSEPKQISQWTKRKILSEIAKLYDPLGWLAPCVAKAKMLMQEIWRLPNKVDWDSSVPNHIVMKWLKVYEQLCLPIPIKVPRWIGMTKSANQTEVHGFCDASICAYAAVIYIVVKNDDDTITSYLLSAKTKLAPVQTVTIPRLELCGAVLLTKLLNRCLQTLAISNCRVFAWSDSMIVLSWLAACPSRWTTFVSNRVSAIQKIVPFKHWNHVPTKQNPADIASRGALIEELASAELWWHGPEFLRKPMLRPQNSVTPIVDSIPEQKKCIKVLHLVEQQDNYTLEYFSCYKQLLRFTVHAMRWKKHTRGRNSAFTAHEIASAEQRWVKIVQGEMFGQDIYNIRHDGWPRVPIIRQLNPFIDGNGILRMNGRVGNADLIEQKTAIILPPKHHLTTLIIREAHLSVMHGGVQLTLRKLREKFWIIHARSQVQTAIHNCVNCFRFRKERMQQQMAELPTFRTEQARPFAFVGCDYAGFFEIKTSTRRNAPTTKGYIALFICLTTKALHLELVSDLSTAEFIMAFENFIARRGIPSLLYTDNGTNFIGGAKEIKRFHDQLFTQNNAVTKLLAYKNIEFKTIPARASHMGGIWERAVGSVKYHLRRTLKNTKLNVRQFDHVLKQIEACLNSRPLWAVSAESDDVEVLTPSHFFNFQAINTLPRPDISHIQLNRLDQYQYLYRLYCDFWNVWSHEYLHQLQPRTKWQKECKNAIVGQIVLIAEDNMPPSQWAVGKITAVYPAKDGLIRAVDVRCKETTLRRPIHKLSLLPIQDNHQVELSAQRGENVGV